MSQMETEGKIDRARGRIRQAWGKLTDDDLDQARGNTENLIGRIKEKTGETTEDIRRKLDDIFATDRDADGGGTH